MFSRIVFAAALAGVLSGLLLTALQQIEIASLLRDAEALEHAASATAHIHASTDVTSHARFDRIAATGLANVILATGFALLISAAMALRGNAGWRSGLGWGVAGFVVFFVAPSLGLPPELPGSQSAPLEERTAWWLGTVFASAAGGWLVAFGTRWSRVLGGALIAAPHVLGAPAPMLHGGVDAVTGAADFVRATYVVNAAFWVVLGGLTGALYETHPSR